jgi:hypothetical protein
MILILTAISAVWDDFRTPQAFIAHLPQSFYTETDISNWIWLVVAGRITEQTDCGVEADLTATDCACSLQSGGVEGKAERQ